MAPILKVKLPSSGKTLGGDDKVRLVRGMIVDDTLLKALRYETSCE
jgi:hypothetical protein